MKKLKLLLLLPLPLLIIAACEENFSPKGDYRDKYVLNCILRSDTSFQVATVSGSYDVEGYNPLDNSTDPFIKGADIRIWYGDNVYVMKDSIIERGADTRYDTPLTFYYVKNLKIVQDSELEIEALLPNGRRLKSHTKVPYAPQLDQSASDFIIPAPGKDVVSIKWTSKEQNLIFAPNIFIVYFKSGANGKQRFIKKVPLNYFDREGNILPNYPQPSNNRALEVELSALRRAMEELSEGDLDKRSYSIVTLVIDVLTYDNNLSRYFASSAQILDQFSIRLDELDYTNIEGGFGIFGAFIKKRFIIRFDEEYIGSFGYLPELNDRDYDLP